MALMIPDNILETLLCSVCHKYLTVKPVKVYQNGEIKCGRCTKPGDRGVVSLFHLVADQSIFRCINMYDGCNEILSFSKVPEHESTCIGKTHACPHCPDSKAVPTFFMKKHFEENHEQALLTTPVFNFLPDEEIEMKKVFLYIVDRELFYVFLKSVSDDYFAIAALHLGDPEKSKNIKQKFILHVDNKIETEEKICGSVNSKDADYFRFKKFKPVGGKSMMITVEIQIKISNKELLRIPLPNYERVGSVDRSTIKTLFTKQNSPFLIRSTDFLPENMSLLRSIYLSTIFCQMYPLNALNARGILVHDIGEVILHCLNCSQITYMTDFNSGYIKLYEENEKKNLLCTFCYSYISSTKSFDEKKIHSRLNPDFLTKISFFCHWNCAQWFPCTGLDEHEIKCMSQPIRYCPEELCEFQGRLFEIRDHFKNNSSCNTLHCGSVNSIKIIPSQSPYRKYIMVSNVFIAMKLIWIEPQWNISISLCGGENNFLQAKALLFENNDKFLGIVEVDQVLKIHHREDIKIKCYLESI
ncbi:hypothetical protein JTB14_021243 [Gonioctena quinquepunctata]|nr:hypothetical protein JTB14_021243 [Gonioctena quinquepunctata]